MRPVRDHDQADENDHHSSQKTIFPGSIELVGSNEGETVTVLLCPGKVVAILDSVDIQARLTEAFAGKLGDSQFASCKLETTRLR